MYVDETTSRVFSSDADFLAPSLPSGAASNVVELEASPKRLVVPSDKSWVEELRDKLGELVKLPLNWDGYDGLPVSFDVAYFSVAVLNHLYRDGIPCPDIVPGSDGSMQIEWHLGGYDIELHVLGIYEIDAWRKNRATGAQDEVEISNDLTLVAGWMRDLLHALHANDDKQLGGQSGYAAG